MDDWNDFGNARPGPNDDAGDPAGRFVAGLSEGSLNSDVSDGSEQAGGSASLLRYTRSPPVSASASAPRAGAGGGGGDARPADDAASVDSDGWGDRDVGDAWGGSGLDRAREGSEEDGGPKSRRLPSVREPLPEEHHHQQQQQHTRPIRGDLDDVPDDYELGIEGMRFTVTGHRQMALSREENRMPGHADPDADDAVDSSMLFRSQKSYTKLEVISAKQITQLLNFYHVFAVLSLVITLLTIILSNTIWSAIQPIPLPEALLPDSLKGNLSQSFIFNTKTGVTFDSKSPLVRPYSPASLPVVRSTAATTSAYSRHDKVLGEFQRRLLSAIGLCFKDYVLVSCPPVPLEISDLGVITEDVFPLDALPAVDRQGVDPEGKRMYEPVFPEDDDAAFPANNQVGSDSAKNQNKILEMQNEIFKNKLQVDKTRDDVKKAAVEVATAKESRDSSDIKGAESKLQELKDKLEKLEKQGADAKAKEAKFSEEARSRARAEPGAVVYILTNIKMAVVATEWRRFVHFISSIMSTFLIVLGGLFVHRISRMGRENVTHEQIWAAALLFVSSFYFNLGISVMQLAEVMNEQAQLLPTWWQDLEIIFGVIRHICFTTITFFYLWANIHTFRILDPTERLGFWSFYSFKLAILIPFGIFKAMAYPTLDLVLSEVPLLTGITLGFTLRDYKPWGYIREECLYAVATTVVELILVILLVVEALRTARVLRCAPYMKNRTKQIGFRFFIYFNFSFWVLFLLQQLLLLLGRPKGENLVYLTFVTEYIVFDVIWFHTVGPCILLLGYVLVLAHVNLPHNSIGVFKGWFKGSPLAPSSSRWTFVATSSDSSASEGSRRLSQDDMSSGFTPTLTTLDRDLNAKNKDSALDLDNELDTQIVEPITYRKRESKDSLELKANCFTMQTHVIMFNFAWYVYYYMTEKMNKFPKDNPLPFRYDVHKHIVDETTDTAVLIIDGNDRIIVTFKGTTSMANLRTSLRIYHERLSNVIRTSHDGEDERARLKRHFGRAYERAKVHQGFAEAYRRVSGRIMQSIKELRANKKRPVFLTGHSLGGALATICSLDLWVSLDVSRREIFVSTFGSPRVGNESFRTVYDRVIPLHWRIVVDPDMVAKLPKVGYHHVGKKVVLTPHGEMFIDPNALELKLWSGNTAGFAYHRKASYMLAMRAWCMRHHGVTYNPTFWPFPVRKEDSRRFAGAYSETTEPSMERGVSAKIIHMDAMVDALGRGHSSPLLGNMAVVEKWGRLTRRILLANKLQGAA